MVIVLLPGPVGVVSPGTTTGPCVIPVQATGVDGSVVGVNARVLVTVGESVAVRVRVAVGVAVGVFVFTTVGVGVLVGVFVGVGVSVGVGEGVAVDEAAIQVDGGTVTWMATLTKTVRALSDLMGSLGVSPLDREINGTILGTIGR